MDEHIRRNKRKILLGGTAFVITILAVTAVFGAWIIATYDNLAGWLALAGFILVDLLTIYAATRSGLWMVRWASRATTVYRGGAEAAKSAAEDISIATGMPVPEIMMIDEEFRNAFSLELRNRRVIIVTSGLIRDLDDDELRAVIAHEMAHLYYEDATLNTFIASLRGFSLITRSLVEHVRGAVDSPLFGVIWEYMVLPAAIIFLVLFPVLSLTVGKGSSETARIIISAVLVLVLNFLVMVAFSRIMQHLINPSREMHADELAVKWTMYPEAMAAALRKVEEYGNYASLKFLKGMFFAPVTGFSTNSMVEPDLQPSIEERIRHLEEVVHAPLDPGPPPAKSYLGN